MKHLVALTLLASAALTPAASRWPYPGLGVESPLKLTDIIARPKYGSLTISPDGCYLATLLQDGAATNIWLLPTDGGPMKPITDSGDRSILITRSVSWTHDSQHVYAALNETQTDIVLLDGLI